MTSFNAFACLLRHTACQTRINEETREFDSHQSHAFQNYDNLNIFKPFKEAIKIWFQSQSHESLMMRRPLFNLKTFEPTTELKRLKLRLRKALDKRLKIGVSYKIL